MFLNRRFWILNIGFASIGLHITWRIQCINQNENRPIGSWVMTLCYSCITGNIYVFAYISKTADLYITQFSLVDKIHSLNRMQLVSSIINPPGSRYRHLNVVYVKVHSHVIFNINWAIFSGNINGSMFYMTEHIIVTNNSHINLY